MTSSEPSDLDRFRGCLLGLAVGDAVGSPFEAIDGYGIFVAFGPADGIVRNPPVELLEYTDDAEMMIGLAEALADDGAVVQANLAAAFARNYDPRRGYGGGAKQVLQAMRDGRDWESLTAGLFPGGSFGNGAAMRVAPVGLLFRDDLDRLDREAELSALPTHRHPLGIDGARLIALAVGMASLPALYDRVAFFSELYARAKTREFAAAIESAATADAKESPVVFGNGVEAQRSVVTAIVCFDQFQGSYADVLAAAIRVGGDVDTIAAMACAISGARLGVGAIPPHLLARLENGVKGRDAIDALAGRLYGRYAAGT